MNLRPSTISSKNDTLVRFLECIGILTAIVRNAEVKKKSPTRGIAIIYPILAVI